MTQMVRKQVYLRKKHDQAVKRLAETRGVSEAEVIRQAIEREAEAAGSRPAPGDAAALDGFIKYALARRRKARAGQPYQWRRDDAYQERAARYGRAEDDEQP